MSTKNNKKINLKEMFSGLQDQMTSQLNTNREYITHPGSKGDSLENAWIDWLSKYLPNRYSVDKAIIIDSEGKTSHQIDIVIYDNWFTPFIFSQNGFHYIPAEGVYAVFEVKPELNKGNIIYASNKIRSVRELKRTTTGIINAGHPCPARPLTKIIGGVLVSTKSPSEDKIKEHLGNLNGLATIDIGCVADKFSFHVNYSGEEKSSKDFNRRILEYYDNRAFSDVRFSEKDNSLVSFFLQLTRYLQQAIGTVPAIDLNEYSKAINFKIDEKI